MAKVPKHHIKKTHNAPSEKYLNPKWKVLQAKPSFLSLCYYSFLTLVHAAIYEAQEETSRLTLA